MGIFPWFYRLWARTRQTEAARWEREKVGRCYFAASKGCGAEQVVWRMMLRNGVAKKEGEGKKAVTQVVKDFKNSTKE